MRGDQNIQPFAVAHFLVRYTASKRNSASARRASLTLAASITS